MSGICPYMEVHRCNLKIPLMRKTPRDWSARNKSYITYATYDLMPSGRELWNWKTFPVILVRNLSIYGSPPLQLKNSSDEKNGTVANRNLSRWCSFQNVLRDRKLYSPDRLHPEVDHNKMMKPVLYGVLASLQYLWLWHKPSSSIWSLTWPWWFALTCHDHIRSCCFYI